MFKDPRVWEASGHTSGFSDPLSECRKCNTRIRVDKELKNIGISADEKMPEAELQKIFEENKNKISCPKCGSQYWTLVSAKETSSKVNSTKEPDSEIHPTHS
jgi:glycyl-tRNA synthetase